MKLSTGLFLLSTASFGVSGYCFRQAEESFAAGAALTKQLDSPKAKPEKIITESREKSVESTQHLLETAGAMLATVAFGVAAAARRSKENAPATGLRFKQEAAETRNIPNIDKLEPPELVR